MNTEYDRLRKQRLEIEAAQAPRFFVVADGGGNGENRFRTMRQGFSAWTRDINEALQFARRQDAELFAAEDEDAWQILPVPRTAVEPKGAPTDDWPRLQYRKIQDFVIGRRLFMGSPKDKSHADIVLELAAKALSEPPSAVLPAQADVLGWAVRSFGPIAQNVDERAARVMEEAIEIAQVEGVPLEVVKRVADRVYSRPPGERWQEIGGTMIGILSYAEIIGLSVAECTQREFQRVLSKPREWWQKKHAEKVAAGTADLSPVGASLTKSEHREGATSVRPAGGASNADSGSPLPSDETNESLSTQCASCGLNRGACMC